MLVDDSAVVRGLMARWIEAEPGLDLVGVAVDGAQAVRKIDEFDPDTIVLDVEMPVMNGLEALPKLLAARPGVKVVMASTLTSRGADVTLRALELGAADYIAKPETTRIGGADAYKRELFDKLKALGARAVARRAAPAPAGGGTATGAARVRPEPVVPAKAAPPLAPFQPRKIDLLAVGASTGGPPALRAFLAALGPDWRLPVVLVQHMPPTFTAILADHLGKATSLKVVEATHGMTLEPRTVYVAPGDWHMTLRREGLLTKVVLDQNPPENWCRPAVDPLFRSVAALYGDRALGVVLTGMGHDGREGARAMLAKGGVVFAQDEASSVVWGMPGAVAEAGLAGLLRPVPGLAEACIKMARGERP